MSYNKAYLRLTSSDRDVKQSVNKSDFVVDVKEKYNVQSVINAQIYQAWCPNVFTNVNQYNNTFVVGISLGGTSTPYTVTMATGQYGISSTADKKVFTDAIDLAVNAVISPAENVSVVTSFQPAPNDSKLLFTFTDGSGSGKSAGLEYSASTEGALSVLGFSKAVVSSLQWTAPYTVNLRGVSQVYIHSKQISSGGLYDGNAGSVNAFCAVSFHDVPYGAMGYFQTTDTRLSLLKYSSARNLSTIKITLRDEKGNKLDIGSSDMTVMLLIEY